MFGSFFLYFLAGIFSLQNQKEHMQFTQMFTCNNENVFLYWSSWRKRVFLNISVLLGQHLRIFLVWMTAKDPTQVPVQETVLKLIYFMKEPWLGTHYF